MNRQDTVKYIADTLEEVRTKIAAQSKKREYSGKMWLLDYEYALEQQLIDLDKSIDQREQ